MVKGTLTMALDFRRDNKRPHEVYSYQKYGQWYVCKSGPTYCNVHAVSDYDEEGLAWLQKIEVDPDAKQPCVRD